MREYEMNEARFQGLFNDNWVCPECGKQMIFTDDRECDLVCEHCGFDTDIDHFGYTDEEYEALFEYDPDFDR